MRHHKTALLTIAIATWLDFIAAMLFVIVEHVTILNGIYWAVTTATTVGYGDVTPHTFLGHLLAIFVMLTIVPLFAAAYSIFTSGLTATHVQRSEKRIKAHIEDRLKEHLGAQK